MVIDSGRPEAAGEDGRVELLVAGMDAAREYHCAACGYGIAVRRALPTCPMCGGHDWEEAPPSPLFSR